MTGEEQFITAIIKKAIEDTTYVGEVNYCKMLAMDTDTIRNKIIANVDMSYTQKQKYLIKSEEKFFA